jgi:hypothetical protein
MPAFADFTLAHWIGLVGLIVFGSVLMYSIVTRQSPPDDRRK